MKKKLFAACLTLAGVLACAFGLAACGGDGDDESDKGTSYSIQAPEESDAYTVSGLPESARAGETVTFRVTLTHPADSVLHYVEVDGGDMDDEKLAPAADGSYSFVMPEDYVSVSVSADYYPDNDDSLFLFWNWADENADNIEIWQPAYEGDGYSNTFDDSVLTASVDNGNYSYELHNYSDEVFSLNQDVIPDDALSVIPEKPSGGSLTTGFDICIDRSKIKAGTAKIVLIVENISQYGHISTLACTVTVTEPEPLEKVTIWQETIVFDVSEIMAWVEEERLQIDFYFLDTDWTDQIYAREAYGFDYDASKIENGKLTFTLPYTAKHKYSVTPRFRMSPKPDEVLEIEYVKGDFADYTGGAFSFRSGGGRAEFKVTRA